MKSTFGNNALLCTAHVCDMTLNRQKIYTGKKNHYKSQYFVLKASIEENVHQCHNVIMSTEPVFSGVVVLMWMGTFLLVQRHICI